MRDDGPCRHCGAPLGCKPGTRRVFCGMACLQADKYAREKVKRAKVAAVKAATRKPITCLHCGDEVVVAGTGPPAKWCSKRCRERHRVRHPREVSDPMALSDAAPVPRTTLPCYACAWSRPNRASETGVECGREAFMTCKPWTAAALFQARRAEA